MKGGQTVQVVSRNHRVRVVGRYADEEEASSDSSVYRRAAGGGTGIRSWQTLETRLVRKYSGVFD